LVALRRTALAWSSLAQRDHIVGRVGVRVVECKQRRSVRRASRAICIRATSGGRLDDVVAALADAHLPTSIATLRLLRVDDPHLRSIQISSKSEFNELVVHVRCFFVVKLLAQVEGDFAPHLESDGLDVTSLLRIVGVLLQGIVEVSEIAKFVIKWRGAHGDAAGGCIQHAAQAVRAFVNKLSALFQLLT